MKIYKLNESYPNFRSAKNYRVTKDGEKLVLIFATPEDAEIGEYYLKYLHARQGVKHPSSVFIDLEDIVNNLHGPNCEFNADPKYKDFLE